VLPSELDDINCIGELSVVLFNYTQKFRRRSLFLRALAPASRCYPAWKLNGKIRDGWHFRSGPPGMEIEKSARDAGAPYGNAASTPDMRPTPASCSRRASLSQARGALAGTRGGVFARGRPLHGLPGALPV